MQSSDPQLPQDAFDAESVKNQPVMSEISQSGREVRDGYKSVVDRSSRVSVQAVKSNRELVTPAKATPPTSHRIHCAYERSITVTPTVGRAAHPNLHDTPRNTTPTAHMQEWTTTNATIHEALSPELAIGLSSAVPQRVLQRWFRA